jgi:hypothetical protein
MTTNIWLTAEDSDITGYKRARLGKRSDSSSLKTKAVSTVAGPSAGVEVLAWITEPLAAVGLTAATWTLHAWALAAAGSASSLRIDVAQFTNTEATPALLTATSTTPIPVTYRDMTFTTGNATATSLSAGDRLVIRLLADDAPVMAVGSVTLYYNGIRAWSVGDTYVICPDFLYLLAALPSATVTAIRSTLKDTDSLNPLLSASDITRAVAGALDEYSSDRPVIEVAALSGDGSTHDFALPANWVTDFSSILAVESPIGQNPASYLKEELYGVYVSYLERQLTMSIRFLSAPSSGTNNVLLTYTTRHTHDTLNDTIPPGDFDAFICLAASRCALALSAKQAGSSDSTIMSDSTDHRGGDSRWRAVANELRKRYEDALHIGGTVSAAYGTGNWDAYLSDLSDRITHPRRYR